MAQVDTSIYKIAPIKSVEEYRDENSARESNRLALQLQGQQVRSAARAEEDANRLRGLWQGMKPGATDADIVSTLQGAGFHKEAEGQRKVAAERAKDAADTAYKTAQADKERLAGFTSKLGLFAQVAGSATDQASYDAALQTLRDNGIDPVAIKAPPQFDPALVARFRQQALTEKDRLEQIWKQKGYDRDVARDAESVRHNRATEGSAAGQLEVARDNLVLRGQEVTLKERELAGQTESGLPVLGVPKPTVTPWANQSNPKDANKVKKSEIDRGAKEVEKDTDNARKEAATAEAARRFIELNGKNPNTGGVSDKIGAGRWIQSMGAEYAEMEAITAKLAPAMREPGSGSTSDFDGKQFERATVGVDKPKKANENIANAIIARAQNSQDYADFRQTYLEQNGTLSGADRHWKEYVNKNPIFDPAKKDGFVLNKGRKPWREHFKPAEAAPPKPADPKPAPGTPNRNIVVDF